MTLSNAKLFSLTRGFCCLLFALVAAGRSAAAGAELPVSTIPDAAAQLKRCIDNGWQSVTLDVAGLRRGVLWQGPKQAWRKGTIVMLHGGGGSHANWCAAKEKIVEPQVRFVERALAEGFAVFLLDSTDKVTDNRGRLCGKVWDDEVRARPNLDLPYIEKVLRELIPRQRPAGSREEIFLTGLSSGGYMTVRAATHFDNLVTAFAPVSSGDPYGWHRECDPELARLQRSNVHGVSVDNETGKRIHEHGSCRAASYPNEKPWESAKPAVKPAFRRVAHEDDGLNDITCSHKVGQQLRVHGYAEEPAVIVNSRGRRDLASHFWLDVYHQPILEFFTRQLGVNEPAAAKQKYSC